MTSTREIIANIPAYMVEIISSHILGHRADEVAFTKGLSDPKRLRMVLDKVSMPQRTLLLDLFELGGWVDWELFARVYGGELNQVREDLEHLGRFGLIFQGGLTGRDPVILLPALIPILSEMWSGEFRPPGGPRWRAASRLSIWGHVTVLNIIRSNRLRCRQGLEPFKKGWKLLEERLGSFGEVQTIYWELVSMGCLEEGRGEIKALQGPCEGFAARGDGLYKPWRFFQSCGTFRGLPARVLELLSEGGLAKTRLLRSLELCLATHLATLNEAGVASRNLLEKWFELGILEEDVSGRWVRLCGEVEQYLHSGEVQGALPKYVDEVIIQPNMEILAPRDLDPLDLLNIGEVADIVKVDVVSVFRITRASIYRALSLGWDCAKIEHFLERISRHVVPDNVVQTIRLWTDTQAHAQLITGTFLVMQGGHDRVPQGMEEILPGIFRLPDKCEEEVVAFLDKRGVMVRGFTDQREAERDVDWGKMGAVRETGERPEARLHKEGMYPYGMVMPLPYGSKGEMVFVEALEQGKCLVIFYPRQGYGEIQVKKISPVYLFRKGGAPYLEAFCEDTGEGEIFDLRKVRALLKE